MATWSAAGRPTGTSTRSRDGRHAYFIAECEGAPVGFAILRDWASAEQVTLVKRVAIARPGQGIGTAMMRALVAEVFTATDAYRLCIGAFPDNLRARRAYEAAGFQVEGVARGSAFFQGSASRRAGPVDPAAGLGGPGAPRLVTDRHKRGSTFVDDALARPDTGKPAIGITDMRLGGRLAAAIEIIEDIDRRHRPAADALKDWGLSHRFAGAGDRAAIGNIVYDGLRRKRSAGWLLDADTPRAIGFGALLSNGARRRNRSTPRWTATASRRRR